MKLEHLTEARHIGANTQKGWSAKKVMETFFEVDREYTKELSEDYEKDHRLYGATVWTQREGLVVYENRHHEDVGTLYQLKNKYIFQDHENETEWEVDPSKFLVQQTMDIYRGS